MPLTPSPGSVDNAVLPANTTVLTDAAHPGRGAVPPDRARELGHRADLGARRGRGRHRAPLAGHPARVRQQVRQRTAVTASADARRARPRPRLRDRRRRLRAPARPPGQRDRHRVRGRDGPGLRPRPGLRPHHVAILGALLVAGALPVWDGADSANSGLLLAGIAVALTGVFDHRAFLHTFGPSADAGLISRSTGSSTNRAAWRSSRSSPRRAMRTSSSCSARPG
jgi:hypothetical protein